MKQARYPKARVWLCFGCLMFIASLCARSVVTITTNLLASNSHLSMRVELSNSFIGDSIDLHIEYSTALTFSAKPQTTFDALEEFMFWAARSKFTWQRVGATQSKKTPAFLILVFTRWLC